MPSGLIALLDDVAMIAKLASASIDDVVGATAKAGTKAAGVVIDDTAVTPRYVHGLTPDRELPIIWKISLGSLRNKLLILLPVAILLASFAPWAVTPLLMLGGSYLAFEATEVSATARQRTLVPVRPAEPLAGAPDRSPIPLADNVQAANNAVRAASANAKTAAGGALERVVIRAQDLLPRRRPAYRRVTPLASRRET